MIELLQEFFSNLISVFKTFEIKDAADIIAITFIVFGLFKLVRETRAEQLLKGIVILMVVYVTSSLFKLTMLTTLIKVLLEFGVILLVIIFQPEIRKALEQIGRSKLSLKTLNIVTSPFRTEEWSKSQEKAIVSAVDSAMLLSKLKTGALIVFEKDTMLSDIAATGTILDAKPSVTLISNIFFDKSPLHDGATIIRDGRILASGCILPLSQNENIDPSLGTRHRAAIGMSEESDAAIIVVSEETGTISIAAKGTLVPLKERETLINELKSLIIPDKDEKKESKLNIFSRNSRKKEKK